MWLGFGLCVAATVALDLAVLHRDQRRIGLKEAVAESAGWIALALGFGTWVWARLGQGAGLEFLTGYLVEKSLSIDNLFLFLLIFQSLKVPAGLQHKVLYYGVAGAVVMRGVFVFGGIALLNHFHWVLFLFGAVLLMAGGRMLVVAEQSLEPERHWLVRGARRFVRVSTDYDQDRFLARQSGKWVATPLLVALLAVEATDIVFAVDSVPAVLAITRDTFIAFSSNVFAILGLRALYFALADLLPRFRFLRPGLGAILLFTGAKIVASDWIPVSTAVSLGVIAGIVVLIVAASLRWPKSRRGAEARR